MEGEAFGHNLGLSLEVRKGAWSVDEDLLLTRYIREHGEGNWHLIPKITGLNRCRKSCRLRWLNYLNPHIKRGTFDQDEIDLISRLHKLLGNRWSLIAGRIPGRTANDVKNFWNINMKKIQKPTCYNDKIHILQKFDKLGKDEVIRPQARKFSKTLFSLKNKSVMIENQNNSIDITMDKTKKAAYQSIPIGTLLEHEECKDSSICASSQQKDDYWQQYLGDWFYFGDEFKNSANLILETDLKEDHNAALEEDVDWDDLWENMDIYNLLRDEQILL